MSADEKLKSASELSKSLLVVSPHFRLFIRDQMTAISHHFAHTTVLVPHPYFPHAFLGIPMFEKRLLFLKNAKDSCKMPESSNIDFFYPQFFMLPIEVMRKRVAVVSALSSTKMVKKHSIKFDLVHLHRLDVGFTGAILKNIYDTPFVITCHGSDVYDFPFKDDYRHSIAKYTLDKVDHVIAVCKSDSDKLLSLGLDPCKLSIIPNGFDEHLFSPIPQRSARAKLRLPPNKRIILAIGTLDEVKGHIHFIEAMRRVLKARSDVLAMIVGSGRLEAKLQKGISKFGLEGKVLLIGREPHNKIPLWINASDVFVMPSLNEGFPTVIPEVLACGKPVIGTNVGGIPDAISDENVGIIVNAADPEALVQAILDSLGREWPSERICEYAQQYSMSTIVGQVLKIYRGVLGKREDI
jgi:glycosyltransferase involved in cell wall biosynthesis